MNTFRGVLDLQVQSVLDALKMQQDRRCRDIESAAGQKAQQLLAESRHRMRERVHEAVVEERQRRETALLEARHRIETASRHRVQEHYRNFLHDAMPMLRAELEQRWRNAASRRSWCEMLLGEAVDKLPVDRWTVDHPGDWSEDDTRWIGKLFAARELPEPELYEDSGIVAGLRVRCGPACLDATLAGLMASRQAVEARLLAALERQLPRQAEDAHD
jgi:hypothetical protein